VTLGTPLALLALALVPVLVLLERWRRRPREVAVASLRLWLDPSGSERPPPARRRWRNLRLLLRIAAATGLALAAAAPAVESKEPANRTLYALVDRSPSRGAADRLDRAMAVVREASTRFDRVRVLFSPPATAGREAGDLTPPAAADRAGAFEDALSGLLAIAAEDPSSRVLAVTDRTPADRTPEPALGIALVGEHHGNAAVTALRVDRDATGLVLFAAWRAWPEGTEAPGLEITADGDLLTTVPGGSGPRTVVRSVPGGVRSIAVSLDEHDALVADDVARARRVSGRRDLGLLTAEGTRPPPALTAALAAVVGDGLTVGTPGRDGGIAYRTTPPAGASGAWIVVRPDAPWRGFRVGAGGGPVSVTDLVVERDLEPAFPAGLPDTLALGPAGELTVPAGARILMRMVDGRPLAATDGTSIVLAFDPTEGIFPESGAHAVLWRTLIGVALGAADAFETEGVLDATESDPAGDVRALPEDFGADLPVETIRGETSLRWIPGLMAVLAVAALLVSRRRRAGA